MLDMKLYPTLFTCSLGAAALALMPAQDAFGLGGIAAPNSSSVTIDFSTATQTGTRDWVAEQPPFDGDTPQLIFPAWDDGLIGESGSFGTGGGAQFNTFITGAGNYGEGGVAGARLQQSVPTSGPTSPDPGVGRFTFGSMSVLTPGLTLNSTGLQDVTRRGEFIGGLDFAVEIKFKATNTFTTDPLIIEVGYESGKFITDEDGAIGNSLIGTSIDGASGNGIAGSEVTGETVLAGQTVARVGQAFIATGGWQTETIQMDALNFANAFQGFFNFDNGTFVTDDPSTAGITEGNAPLAFDAGQIVVGPTASTRGDVTLDVEYITVSGNDVVVWAPGDVSRDQFIDDADIDMYSAALRAYELDKQHRGDNLVPIDSFTPPYFNDALMSAADFLELDDMMQRALPDRGDILYADWSDPVAPIFENPKMAQEQFFEIQKRFKLTGTDKTKADFTNDPFDGLGFSRVYNFDKADLDILIQDILNTDYGDVNLDGVIDVNDANIANGNLGMTNAGWADGDMNQDFVVDALDMAIIGVTPGGIPGDLNGDGFVGLSDLDIILNNWNQSIPPGDPLADPTGDNFVGLADLDIVLNNWNAGTPPGSASIPEPASLALLSLGGVAVLRRRG